MDEQNVGAPIQPGAPKTDKTGIIIVIIVALVVVALPVAAGLYAFNRIFDFVGDVADSAIDDANTYYDDYRTLSATSRDSALVIWEKATGEGRFVDLELEYDDCVNFVSMKPMTSSDDEHEKEIALFCNEEMHIAVDDDYKGKTIYLTDAEATTCASFRFDSNFVKIIEYKTTSFKDYEQECTPTLGAPLLHHMIQEPAKS